MEIKKIKKFLQKVLRVIEITFYVAYFHCDKVFFIGIIALDQFTKSYVMNSMTVGETIPVVQNFFHFTYVLNPGAAFGILPNQRAFFIVVGVMMLMLAIFSYFHYSKLKNIDTVMKYGGITAAAGALANLIDRVQFGFVIDFFDFRIFPIFNVADVAIVVGMFVMMYVVLFKPEKDNKFKEVRPS